MQIFLNFLLAKIKSANKSAELMQQLALMSVRKRTDRCAAILLNGYIKEGGVA